MVWSKHDFERELKRQLIEIASIRKRVPKRDEIMERLDRLEESHLCLIRKLGEYFQSLAARGEESHRESQSRDSADRASEDALALDGMDAAGDVHSGHASVDDSLLAEFYLLSAQKSPLARRCLLHTPATGADDSEEDPSPQVVLVAEAVLNVPDLNERCATCGKVLISSLLAGEGITQQGSGWHHQACIESDPDDHPSSILN